MSGQSRDFFLDKGEKGNSEIKDFIFGIKDLEAVQPLTGWYYFSYQFESSLQPDKLLPYMITGDRKKIEQNVLHLTSI